MLDPRALKLARLLVTYGAEVRPGDLVKIQSDVVAAPLVEEVYRQVVRAGGFPITRLSTPHQDEIFLKEASDELLRHCPDYLLRDVQAFDAVIHVLAPENTQRLRGVDPRRQAIHRQATAALSEAFWERMAPDAERPLRWTLGLMPTHALAQDAGMSLPSFRDYAFRACFLDEDDPVATWRAFGRRQQPLVDRAQKAREIHILGEGTDLRVRVEGRHWVNDDGRKNMPGGEFFTSPIEDSAEGRVRFGPPACMFGRRVEGVEMVFEQGRVVSFSARYEEEFLGHMLGLDEGARYLGEVAFGNNPAIDCFTGNVLFDEKVAGTMHIALGASIPECGGRNTSSLHWDMVIDLREAGEVYLDGELFLDKGRFVGA